MRTKAKNIFYNKATCFGLNIYPNLQKPILYYLLYINEYNIEVPWQVGKWGVKLRSYKVKLESWKVKLGLKGQAR